MRSYSYLSSLFHSKRDAWTDLCTNLQVVRKRTRATFLLGVTERNRMHWVYVRKIFPRSVPQQLHREPMFIPHSTPSHSHPVRVEVIDSAQPPSAVKSKPQWFQLRTYQRMLKSSVEPNRIMYSVKCREPISCWPPLSIAWKRQKTRGKGGNDN